MELLRMLEDIKAMDDSDEDEDDRRAGARAVALFESFLHGKISFWEAKRSIYRTKRVLEEIKDQRSLEGSHDATSVNSTARKLRSVLMIISGVKLPKGFR